MAKNCPNFQNNEVVALLIQKLIPDLLLLPREMDPGFTYLSLCNNAIYALIEMITPFHTNFESSIIHIIEKLDQIITKNKMNRSLLLNWAIFVGKIGQYFPDKLEPYMNQFLKPFSIAFIKSQIEDDGRKSAFNGIIKVCALYPQKLDKVTFFL